MYERDHPPGPSSTIKAANDKIEILAEPLTYVDQVIATALEMATLRVVIESCGNRPLPRAAGEVWRTLSANSAFEGGIEHRHFAPSTSHSGRSGRQQALQGPGHVNADHEQRNGGKSERRLAGKGR